MAYLFSVKTVPFGAACTNPNLHKEIDDKQARNTSPRNRTANYVHVSKNQYERDPANAKPN